MDSLSWCHRGRRRKRGSSQLQYRNATSPDLAPSHQLSSLRTPTTHTWPPPPPPGKGHLFLPAPPSTRRYLRPAALRGLLRATPPTPGGARPGPTVAARRVRPFPFPLAPTYRRWGAPVGGGAQDSLRGPARTFSALPGGAACCASPRYAAAPCPPTPPALTLARPGRAGRPEGWPLLDLRRRHGLRKNTDRHRRKFKGRPPRVLDLLTDGAAFRGMAPCSSSQPASCQRATFDHLDWSSWNPGPKDEAGSGRLWQATGGRSPPPTTALLTWVGQRGNVRGGGQHLVFAAKDCDPSLWHLQNVWIWATSGCQGTNRHVVIGISPAPKQHTRAISQTGPRRAGNRNVGVQYSDGCCLRGGAGGLAVSCTWTW